MSLSLTSTNHNIIVLVYLSRYGCLDYTKAIAKSIPSDLHLIISESNTETFSRYTLDALRVPDTKAALLLNTIVLRQKINRLLNRLLNEKNTFVLYFPAFHPLNELFLNWAIKNNIKSVITIHDYVTHEGEKSTITETLQKRFIKKASQVNFLSHFVKNQAEKELGPNNNFKIRPHPILPSNVLNTKAHSARPKLLFLGRVVDYKNVPVLIKSIKDLDIEKLTIAGQQMPKRDFNPNTDPRIEIIDKVLTDAEISHLLAEHHILVLPYLSASQSGILTLGIASEMVMVISKVGGLVEQLSPEGAIWVEPTEEGIRVGLELLMKSKSVYNKVKKAVIAFKS